MKQNKTFFTLLEMLLASAILAIIGSLGSMLLFGAQQTWTRMRECSMSLQEKTRLDSVANQLFSNLIPFYWTAENNSEKIVFAGEPESILFVCRQRINGSRESGLRFVKIFCNPEKQLIISYRQYPILPWQNQDASSMRQEILAKKISKINFEYAKRNTGEIRWHKEWPEPETVPAAISWTIEWENGDVVRYLRRCAGSGHSMRYGKENHGTK